MINKMYLMVWINKPHHLEQYLVSIFKTSFFLKMIQKLNHMICNNKKVRQDEVSHVLLKMLLSYNNDR